MTTFTESGRQMRKALREAFPGRRFSVRQGGGMSLFIHVTWTGGPTEAAVREVVTPLALPGSDGVLTHRTN